MSPFVIDASVAAKLLFEEPGTAAAESLLSSAEARLLAPELLPLELASVVWKRHRRAELTAEQAAATFQSIAGIPVELLPLSPLLPAAFEIAIALDRTVYDSLYIATALAEGGTFISADQKLVNALRQSRLADRVRLLDEFA